MDTATKKLYQIQYNDHKVTYSAEKLDSVAARYGHYGDLRDGDYLAVAVELYCDNRGGVKMADKIDTEALRRQILAEFARSGGQAKTAKKAAAARENGKKGGRPRKDKSGKVDAINQFRASVGVCLAGSRT